jgi:glycosyltransferase involved in cell wall biosynthesis
MRIAYVNHGRFPTEKAYGFQIAQVCDALTDLGHQVTLLNPVFKNTITESAQDYYGLRHPLRVEPVKHYDAFQSRVVPGSLGFIVSMHSYARALRKRLAPKQFDLFYVRSPLIVSGLIKTGIPLALELHALPRFAHRRFVHIVNQCERIICLTTPMRDEIVSWGVHPGKVIVEGDAVDLRRFQNLPDLHTSKTDWELPVDRTVIGYVGSLATRETLEKGVRELVQSMAGLGTPTPERPFLWIVGGPEKWQKTYEQVARQSLNPHEYRFQGRIDASSVPSAIAACDICVYPSPKTDHPYFLRDTSPLKLFEYLAAAKPIICADLPPVRDIVDEKSVKFFRPGDVDSLRAAIENVLQHPAEAAARAAEGKRIVQKHSWEKRMERILATLPHP